MRNIISIISLLLLLSLSACSGESHTGNGHLASQTRKVGFFDKIQISGNINVLAATNRTNPQVMVTTDSNLLPYIITKVTDNTLYIHPKKGMHLRPTEVPTINLRAKEIKEVVLDGSVRFKLTNMIGQNLIVNLSGNSSSNLRGRVKSLTIKSSGSNSINAVQLEAENVNIHLNGSGNIKVAAEKNLEVVIAGSGVVEYFGNPEINQDISGSGKILEIPRK